MKHSRTHSTTEPERTDLTTARTRLTAGTAAIAVLALFLVGCGDLITAPQEPAYPRFSLTGDMPDRVDTFDVRVEGPDMETIEEELTREGGEITFEVPAGRDRTFELLARDDVYAARRTVSLAPGRETTVDMDVYPGPVFLDQNGIFTGQEQSPGINKIRDLGVATSEVYTDNSSRFAGEADFGYDTIADAGYDDNDRLWVVGDPGPDWIGLRIYSSWGAIPESPDVTMEDYFAWPPSAADVTISEQRVAVAGASGFLSIYNFDGEELTLPTIEGDSTIASISDLAFDDQGRLWAIGEVDEGDTGTDLIPAIIRYDRQERTVNYRTLPGDDPTVPVYTGYAAWGDVRIVDDDLFVFAATYPQDVLDQNGYPVASELNDADHPSVYRYNLDMELQETWGRRVASSNPMTGEFWGPRRFVASRRDGELIIIDQKDNDGSIDFDGTGRLLRFEFDSSEGWEVFGEGEFGFFSTGVGA